MATISSIRVNPTGLWRFNILVRWRKQTIEARRRRGAAHRRRVEEEDPYGAPNELDPVSGYEFVGRDQEERLFDVFAIARRVQEMGVVDDGQGRAEHSPATPRTAPLVTDLNARESTPKKLATKSHAVASG